MTIKRRNIKTETQNTKHKTTNTNTKTLNTKHKTPGLHFLILGYGRFGQLALRRLKQEHPSAKFTIVDNRPGALTKIRDESVEQMVMDGISAIMSRSPEMEKDDWIIPAIPIHVAFKWLKHRVIKTYQLEVIKVQDEILQQLPNPIRGENGVVYTSIADFVCPDDCPEPETICTCTGKPRPIVLNEALESIKHQLFQPIVIYSRQLAPGVGGYQVSDMESALTKVSENTGPFLLATACKCHGVIHAFRLMPIG